MVSAPARKLERISLGGCAWGMLVCAAPLSGLGRFSVVARPAAVHRPRRRHGRYAPLAGALGGLLFAAFAEVAQTIRRWARATAVGIASALATALLLPHSLTVVGHMA
jgi:hypothetical protein